MSAPAMVREQVASIPDAAEPTEIHKWVMRVGPMLLRLLKERGWLTCKEWRLMRAVKELCPCHWTDHPGDFFPNGETCECCGRPK